jgi:hypothetical protein
VVSGRKATNWLSGEALTFRRTSVETAGDLIAPFLEPDLV